MKLLYIVLCSALALPSLHSQCETWIDSQKKEEAENAHVIYRQHIKSKNFEEAFKFWKTAYEIAPAADGLRDSHFKDGIEIYKHFFNNESDADKKAMYKDKILALYDQLVECIEQRAIKYKNCNEQACVDLKKGVALGRKAYDMYYTLLVPRAQTYEVIKQSVELGGLETEYLVLHPYADILLYLYTTDKVDAQTVRDAHQLMLEIADFNIENDERYKAYYESAKASMSASIAKIEPMIYDCEYFINKLKPEYDENPEDIETIENIIKILKRQKCPQDHPFLAELEEKYSKYAAEFNAQQQADFEKKNPSVAAKRLYDEGKYNEAIAKYREAIAKEEDTEKKASYYFSMASIQFRKLGQYAIARDNARKAANLRDGWGRPYMLIGDMYAKSSSSCGKDAYTRGLAVLAAIDKWQYAKSVDSEVGPEANRLIARFSQYMPPEEDAFMQGKSAGQSVKVECWIGESVKLRFN